MPVIALPITDLLAPHGSQQDITCLGVPTNGGLLTCFWLLTSSHSAHTDPA